MSDITLVLGDFTFQDFEVPEEIGFGGDQKLAVKKMLGGVRDIQALGTDWRPIAWSGQFFPTQSGQSALDRALTLEQMKNAAQPLALSWDELYLMVYIRTFEPDYRFARIPYKIVLEVLQDLTAPVYADADPDADDIINADLDSANTLTASTGDSALSGLMSAVSSAVSSVQTFVGAAASVVAPVLQAVHQAQAYVQSAIGTVDSTLASVGVPAGVLPGVPILQNLSSFTSILGATGLQTQYLQIGSVLGRMSTNLTQTNSSSQTLTVGGGNLFDIASSQYGDATQWTQISDANPQLGGDPQITGIQTITVPPASASTQSNWALNQTPADDGYYATGVANLPP
jgi:nucleoid-associated protein YgaU